MEEKIHSASFRTDRTAGTARLISIRYRVSAVSHVKVSSDEKELCFTKTLESDGRRSVEYYSNRIEFA